MFNCCSHGTLLHFGLQSSHLNICYYHQDLHLRRLNLRPCPRLLHHRSSPPTHCGLGPEAFPVKGMECASDGWVSCRYLAIDGVYHLLWAAFPNNPTQRSPASHCPWAEPPSEGLRPHAGRCGLLYATGFEGFNAGLFPLRSPLLRESCCELQRAVEREKQMRRGLFGQPPVPAGCPEALSGSATPSQEPPAQGVPNSDRRTERDQSRASVTGGTQTTQHTCAKLSRPLRGECPKTMALAANL
ncbi:hypothetical protein KOW79_005845 [Hemibagrus wyckioides]|uniref:Uncharacterized protein n=1 Tax=Hemibagrus wyckioides TaxID=337641 RepID=A0A9D3P0J1_9TELE|nr:hypothetical protein KOW79_005845 [Hemibagrus wyckioides]